MFKEGKRAICRERWFSELEYLYDELTKYLD
jgi:hypothetical protein